MNASKSRRRMLSMLRSLPLLAVGLAATAGANPMPESAIYVHVQPVQADFCDTSPITECSQIEQYTYATGELEFDIFLWGPDPQAVAACAFQVTWPATWQYLGGEICHGGLGGINVSPGSAAIAVDWWPYFDCPMLADEVLLAARLVFNVGGYGELAVTRPATITWGCPPEGDPVPVDWWSSATAGVVCAYCYDKCPGQYGYCVPGLNSDELRFELPEGGADQQMIEAGVYPPSGGSPHFAATEPWMSLSVEHPGPDYWQVTVTVDATGLDPGRHEGWVMASCGCRDCTHVTLDVLSSQGVPEGPDVAPPDSARSWGRVKSLYR